MKPMIAAAVAAMLVARGTVGCSAPGAEPGAGARLGVAEQLLCGGVYVTHAARRAGTIFYVGPETLATAADGWGPQTLALSVDQGFTTQVDYDLPDNFKKLQDQIKKSVATVTGFDLTESVDLIASTAVLVPTDAYYRLEGYPEYEEIDWDLHVEACGPWPDRFVSTGAVYRPVGIHFRVLDFVGGAWNALGPPDPPGLVPALPWGPAPARGDAGAP
jgi:hypothetical protein